MADAVSDGWVLPTDLPITELRARDLEECVYWLLDAMGAQDLEWRTGGSGSGAADGGRDLEATFYVPSPDGEMEPQHWWIECKGRRGTVEADEVKSAVNNAAARGELAYLAIVTNTTFSNPTRDWVKLWQTGHPLPRIKLWDHETLERLLSRHPNVVLRLFSEALSPAGLLKVVQQRFWDKLEYTPLRALTTLWSSRDRIDIDPMERVALVANEFAHGSINDRPWAAQAPLDQLVAALHSALANLPYFGLKASKIGVDEEPLFAAIAHMILVSLQSVDAGKLAKLVLGSVQARQGEVLPEEVVDVLLPPPLERLAGEMQDVCAADCKRVTWTGPATLVGSEDPVKLYWRRLDPKGGGGDGKPRKFLRLEKLKEPCKVGFELDDEHCCPLFEMKPTTANLAEFLAVVERVSEFRNAQAKAKAAEEA